MNFSAPFPAPGAAPAKSSVLGMSLLVWLGSWELPKMLFGGEFHRNPCQGEEPNFSQLWINPRRRMRRGMWGALRNSREGQSGSHPSTSLVFLEELGFFQGVLGRGTSSRHGIPGFSRRWSQVPLLESCPGAGPGPGIPGLGSKGTAGNGWDREREPGAAPGTPRGFRATKGGAGLPRGGSGPPKGVQGYQRGCRATPRGFRDTKGGAGLPRGSSGLPKGMQGYLEGMQGYLEGLQGHSEGLQGYQRGCRDTSRGFRAT